MNEPRPESIHLVPTLVFHKVTNRFTFGSTNFPPERLRQLLTTLRKRDQLVALSFDDGYAHLAEILPELVDQFGLSVTVFVPTAFVGKENRWDYSYRLSPFRHLNPNEIGTLAERGVGFGSHGHSHVDLTRCHDDQLVAELRDSKAILEDIVGSEIDSISYPFGKLSDRVMEAADEAGYRIGYSMKYPDRGEADLARGRIAVYGYDTPLSIMRKLIGPLLPLERLKNRITNKLSSGTTILDQLKAAIRRSGPKS